MTFSIIYWNLWLDNQIQGKHKAKHLFEALGKLIEDYDPDCFGLNEVLCRSGGKQTPFVLEHLKQKGYKHAFYLASGPWTQEWDIGDAIVSKYPLVPTDTITLGDHYSIDGRDPSGRQAKAAQAEVLLRKGTTVHVIAAHLMNLRIRKLPTHFRHQQNLAYHIGTAPRDIRLVAGGDFNEFKIMPFSFAKRNSRNLHSKTGTALNPTWFKGAKRGALLRANPDKVFWLKNDLMQLVDFQVIPNFTSDHRPLYAKFSIKEKS